ncbi:DUF4856 domain-containing protein [Neolewinella agarilytica]|uniref:DUF4856 domain-containing protein n=1 Tax=Neolewinella agarilytica TaxID=478744 RepID=A0A1H8Z008_9BACT|nr:DUF4856 domain-containing protein [Neolewinella agarilytica]SEP57839.1 protein of unknown function [Neolewinella agarilytica]
MKLSIYSFLALFLVLAATGCDDDDIMTPSFVVPDTYAFERNGTSTVSFSGQTERLGMAQELSAALLDFSKSEEDLFNMYQNPEGVDPFSDPALNEATKSISSKVAASRDLFFTNATAAAAIKADFDAWISGQVNEVFPNENELAARGQAGQVADGGSVRYVNEWGLEYNQAFSKALIGGLMYDQAVNNYLSTAVLDEGTNQDDNDMGITVEGESYTNMEHKWDEAFGYIFGLSANPAQPLDDLGEADNFLNKYLSRVEDDPDFTGIAANLESDFRLGRAAIVVGEYAERDARANRIKEILTDVLVIRSIYYLKQAEAQLRATPLMPQAAFHDLSEAYGFVYSLRFIRLQVDGQLVDYTTFSDNSLAALRNADDNGFWGLEADELATLAEDIASVFFINLEAAAN